MTKAAIAAVVNKIRNGVPLLGPQMTRSETRSAYLTAFFAMNHTPIEHQSCSSFNGDPSEIVHGGRQGKSKILAISSGGGHWVQMLRLRPAFDGSEVVFATVRAGYSADVGDSKFRLIPDANRWNKLGLLRTVLSVGRLILSECPDVVISTGAAPGFFAIVFGRYFGARTIWVDSVANAEILSMSGQKAGRFAHLWLTQWPHLARTGGPHYFGNVL